MFKSSLNNAGHGVLIETYISGKNFYRIYSDGWCEQGGMIDKGSYNTATETVNLLKPYKTSDYNIYSTIGSESIYACYSTQILMPINSTDFKVGVAGSNIRYIYWYTCGYIN